MLAAYLVLDKDGTPLAVFKNSHDIEPSIAISYHKAPDKAPRIEWESQSRATAGDMQIRLVHIFDKPTHL